MRQLAFADSPDEYCDVKKPPHVGEFGAATPHGREILLPVPSVPATDSGGRSASFARSTRPAAASAVARAWRAVGVCFSAISTARCIVIVSLPGVAGSAAVTACTPGSHDG